MQISTSRRCDILVLSRHRDESIFIGDDIVITVVDLRGDKVRIGFTAPESVSIHRREVYEAILAEDGRGSPGDLRRRQVEGATQALRNHNANLLRELHAERAEKYRLQRRLREAEAELEAARAPVRNGKDGVA